jgi:predicted acetyltransferase
VEELVTVTTEAAARLWRYCLEVDWIATVKAENRGPDEILPWLLVDARMAAQHDRTDLQWVRILNTVGALEARRYLAPGHLVLELDDPMGHAAGRFVLEGGPDGAECRPTTETADLRLAVSTLSTAYLGGTTLAQLARAGLVDEATTGALALADAMFRSPAAPWSMVTF